MDLPRHWRLRHQRYKLEGATCDGCGRNLFPPREICPHCGSDRTSPKTFSGRGEVYSYSIVYKGPSQFEEMVPYVVALVKLEEGPLVTAQITDIASNQVEIGMAVEMVTRKLIVDGEDGFIIYGYKFRPHFNGTKGPSAT